MAVEIYSAALTSLMVIIPASLLALGATMLAHNSFKENGGTWLVQEDSGAWYDEIMNWINS